jgi:signal transduction histidine kinase
MVLFPKGSAVFLLLAPSTTPPPNATLVVLLATIVIALVAAAAALEATRRSRTQHRRADNLARDLSRVNASVRRRLNFLNAISHDLRTPLNGITLQTHIIDRALATGDHALLQRCAADIRRSSALAAEILDALLQYAHTDIEQNAIASFSLKELLQQVADPFRAAAEEKHLAFSLAVPEGLQITTDRDKLQRIIANLLDNAVKFTQHGAIAIRVSAPADSHTLLVEVSDSGPGIAPDHLHHLFQEFYPVGNPSRDPALGLGLGLVVARRLASQLGGSLQARSTPGEGSSFLLEIPRHSPESLSAAPHKNPGLLPIARAAALI